MPGCPVLHLRGGSYTLVAAAGAGGGSSSCGGSRLTGGQQQQQVLTELDAVTCAVCLDVYHKPAYLPSCKHSFCMKCILKHAHKAEKTLCPLCRSSFDPKHVVRDRQKQGQIQSAKTQCRACFKLVTVSKLRTHAGNCVGVLHRQTYRFTAVDTVTIRHHSGAPGDDHSGGGGGGGGYHSGAAPPGAHHSGGGAEQHRRGAGAGAGRCGHRSRHTASYSTGVGGTTTTAAAINRHTFSCPLCAVGNLDVSDLRVHCDDKHGRSHAKQRVQCPVCAVVMTRRRRWLRTPAVPR